MADLAAQIRKGKAIKTGLSGADLSGADLVVADLGGAMCDRFTRWPVSVVDSEPLVLSAHPDLSDERARQVAMILNASVMGTRLTGKIDWAAMHEATAAARRVIFEDESESAELVRR